MTNNEIKKIALEKIKNNKLAYLLIFLSTLLIGILTSQGPGLIALIVSPVITYSLYKVTLSEEPVSFFDSFNGISWLFIGKNLVLALFYFLISLAIIIIGSGIIFSSMLSFAYSANPIDVAPQFLFSLLLLIIISCTLTVYVACLFAPVPYLAYSEQSLGVGETLNKAKTMMKGQKLKLVGFELSLLLWVLVALIIGIVIITLGTIFNLLPLAYLLFGISFFPFYAFMLIYIQTSIVLYVKNLTDNYNGLSSQEEQLGL